MRRKYDLSWRIGMIMMLLCAALVITVLPAAADYTADRDLDTYTSGTITGDMNYTIGNSYYSPKMWSNGSYVYTTTIPETIPNNAQVALGRLYVYWTWSYNATNGVNQGVNPIMEVKLNGATLTCDARYMDRKGTGTYDYPSGTDCYNVTSNISTGTNNYVVNITNTYGSDKNQSFNIQAVGLLTLYNNSSSQKDYWINEGCDMTLPSATIPPSLATTNAAFSNVNNSSVKSAILITVVPSGNTVNNTLYFNNETFPDAVWTGVWDGSPRDGNFSYNTTNVTGYLLNGNNLAKLRNGLPSNNYLYNDSQMQAANAFLLVNRSV